MNIKFKHDNETYTLQYETINVLDACSIDYNSYIDDKTSEMLEWKYLLQNIHFKLYCNNNHIFDSSTDDPNKIEFKLLKKIISLIQEELEISNQEIVSFLNDCTNFLKKETTKMPPELIIAQSIASNRLQLNLSDIEKMSVKTYEKINLALNLLTSLE